MDKKFKQVNIAIDDWNEYNELAKAMSNELGVKVYIPGALKKAVAFYKSHGKNLS